MPRLPQWWIDVRGSLWFVPGQIVLGAVAAAIGLVQLDLLIAPDVLQEWPLLFGAGADGSRALLSAVATSMITVAGVVFSITVVALSLRQPVHLAGSSQLHERSHQSGGPGDVRGHLRGLPGGIAYDPRG